MIIRSCLNAREHSSRLPSLEPVEHELTRLQAELAPEIAGCHWTSTRPFHITLAFLGDVPDSDLNEICQTVTASTVSLDRFEVEVRGLGVFPNASRPRVIWAGVTATNINALNELHQSVDWLIGADWPRSR